MAQDSYLWTTGATGDGATAYTQAKCIRWQRQTFCGADNEGVLKDYLNELATTGTSSPVATNTGGAYVYGFPYHNTASVDTAIPTPSGNTRIDRIVLRAGWAAQTVRITRIAGTEGSGTPPALVQTDGTTWDIPQYQASITTGGVITLTDEREFLHPNIAVDGDMLDDDAVDSQHYAAGSIDTAHIADSQVTLAKMAANSVDSGQYVDGSIDLVHMSANSVDSDQYVDNSIDLAHMSANSVDSDQYVDASVDPIHIANRTRRLFVPALIGYNTTDSASIGLSLQAGSSVIALPDSKSAYASGRFAVPSDYASSLVVQGIAFGDGTGNNIYAQNFAVAGGCGESQSTHTSTTGFAAEAMDSGSASDYSCHRQLTVTAIDTADFVRLNFTRNAVSASDTVVGAVYFLGWIVEYTADS